MNLRVRHGLLELRRLHPIPRIVLRLLRLARRHPTAVRWRHPEVSQVSAKQISFGGRGSFSSATHEETSNFFHGDAITVRCDSRRKQAGDVEPCGLFFAIKIRWRFAEFAGCFRFIFAGSFALWMLEKSPASRQFCGWNSRLRHSPLRL
jgi:hypothetical protein